MNRRNALRSMGAAAGALALPAFPSLGQAAAQAPAAVDWATRVSALPQAGAGEVVVTAVGDLMLSRPEGPETASIRSYATCRRSPATPSRT